MESRPSRPQRNRRHSRRAWPPEDDTHHLRPAKRLFTPEIKRMLKDWLIRRRENPYPSRDEKKRLAIETGLTYTQICNWFANWRRKLKNSEHEKAKKSWGHLIKNYNTNARGNVEQFSISSEDSIWEESGNRQDELQTEDEDDFFTGSDTEREGETRNKFKATTSYLQAPHTPKFYMEAVRMEHSNYYPGESGYNTTAQCYQISSTTHEFELGELEGNQNKDVAQPQQQQQQTFSITNKAKYKQQIIEKYLRDTHENSISGHNNMATPTAANCGAELSKWLESAAKFRPNKNNYFIGWNKKRNKQEKRQRIKPMLASALVMPTKQQTQQQQQQQQQQQHIYDTIHHKDELDAAEALANLAFNCRQRMLDGHVLQTHPNNAIPST